MARKKLDSSEQIATPFDGDVKRRPLIEVDVSDTDDAGDDGELEDTDDDDETDDTNDGDEEQDLDSEPKVTRRRSTKGTRRAAKVPFSGTRVKHPAEALAHFPKPPRFKCEPLDFFKYWGKLHNDPKFSDRIMVYVYRLWPVLLNQEKLVALHGRDRAKQIHTNIDKPDVPIIDLEDTLLRYGSGDYHIKLNDAGHRKCITQTTIRGLRDMINHPPIIEKLDMLDRDDPSNNTFFDRLRNQGIRLPWEEPEVSEGDQVSNKAIEEMSRITNRLLESKEQSDRADRDGMRNRAPNVETLAISKGLEIMGKSSQAGADILSQAMRQALELNAGDKANPAEQVRLILEAAKTLAPQGPTRSPLDELAPILGLLSARDEAANIRIQQIQDARMAFLETQLREKATTAEKPKTALEQLKELAEMRETLSGLVGDDKPSKSDRWAELGSIALQALSSVASAAVLVTHNLAVARTGQGQPVDPNAQQQQQQQQQTQQTQALPAGQPGNQSQGQPGQATAGPANMFEHFLMKIEKPLLGYYNTGRTGVDFAEFLIELGDAGMVIEDENGKPQYQMGQQVYYTLKEMGEDVLNQLILGYEPISRVVTLTPTRWKIWLNEFVTADNNWGPEEEEEEEGIEGEETEEGDGENGEAAPGPVAVGNLESKKPEPKAKARKVRK